LAFRYAVLELWGEFGWREVTSALDAEARERLLGAPVSPVCWVPERHMMALSEAVFAGPAGGGEEAYLHFVTKMIEHGFGRIRRFVLQLAPPELLLGRAPELWRHDHTHGVLTVSVAGSEALAVLRDHDHVRTPLSRLTAAQAFRAALERTRAKNVVVTHDLDPAGALEVRLRWS
jgi:hypothetical protein